MSPILSLNWTKVGLKAKLENGEKVGAGVFELD